VTGTKPLADKTRRRIAAGIARYWRPFHLEAGGHTYDAADPKHPSFGDPNAYYRAWSVDDVLKTLHTIESKALAVPVEGRDGKEARTTSGPLRTQTTRLETALVVRPAAPGTTTPGPRATRCARAQPVSRTLWSCRLSSPSSAAAGHRPTHLAAPRDRDRGREPPRARRALLRQQHPPPDQ
jgi:hypothetical protein